MSRPRRARAAAGLVLAALGACADDAPLVRPILDLPEAGSPADPYPGVDRLSFWVHEQGREEALVSVSISAGQPLRLSGVPFGSDLIFELAGLDHRGVVISSGRTCAVTVSADAPPPEPHLYFSRLVEWAVGPAPLAAGWTQAAGAALPDGSALFVAAEGAVERFAPLDGAFAQVDAVRPRTGATLVLLDDGRAIVAGGHATDGPAEPVTEVEVVDPAAIPGRRITVHEGGPGVVEHAGLSVSPDEVLLAGGLAQAAAGPPTVTRDIWKLRLTGDALEIRARAGALAHARAGHTMTPLVDDPTAGVLVAGGRDETGAAVAEAEVYWPLFDRFEALPGARLQVPRWGHQAARLPGGWILVVGGLRPPASGIGDPVPVTELELYNPAAGAFQLAGELPGGCEGGAGLVDFSLTPLPDGRLLVAGGRDACGAPVATAVIVDLSVTGQVGVSRARDLGAPRVGHGAVLLCDGTILALGGAAAPLAERYRAP